MKACKLCGRTYDDRVDFCFADGSVLELSLEPRAATGRLSDEQYPTMVPEDIGMRRAPMSRSSSPTLLPEDMEIDEEDFETPEPRPLSEHPEPTIIPEEYEYAPPPAPTPQAHGRMRGPFGGSVLPEETAPLPIPIIKGEDRLGGAPKAPRGGVRVGPPPEEPKQQRPQAFGFDVQDSRAQPIYHQEAYQYDTVGVFDEDQDPDERPTEIDDGSEAYFSIEEDPGESMPAAVPFEDDDDEELEPEALVPPPVSVPRTPTPAPAPAPQPERPSLKSAYSPPPPSLSSNPPDIRITRPLPPEEPNRTPMFIGLAVLLLAVVLGGGWWAFSGPKGPDTVVEVTPDPPVEIPVVETPPPVETPVVETPPVDEPTESGPGGEEPVVETPEQPQDGVAEGGAVGGGADPGGTPTTNNGGTPTTNNGGTQQANNNKTNNGGGTTEPPKPTTGVLSISVTPSSALIFVDDKQVGTGSAKVTTSLGNHTVVARQDGWSTVEKKVRLSDAQQAVNLQLEQAASTGVVKLFGTPGSKVFIGDRTIDTLPATITLPEGSYTFRVVTPTNVSYTVSKTIRFTSPGKPVNVSLMPD